MSRGRHARPGARGGGFALLLALLVAVGAVALALLSGGTSEVQLIRLGLVGLAVVTIIQLLTLARTQRDTSRTLARSEERLRVLEQRSRLEGDDLHRRVLDSVSREGQLRAAVEVLATEISRLRGVLDQLNLPLPAEGTPVLDLPLLQQTFTRPATDSPRPVTAPESVPRHAATTGRPFGPPSPPAGGGSAPLPAAPRTAPPTPAAARATSEPWPPAASPGSTWVVREIMLEGDVEPAASAAVIDLTEVDEVRETSPWTSFARPA